MIFSRRQLLASLGLALPAVAVIPAKATATTDSHKKHKKHSHTLQVSHKHHKHAPPLTTT